MIRPTGPAGRGDRLAGLLLSRLPEVAGALVSLAVVAVVLIGGSLGSASPPTASPRPSASPSFAASTAPPHIVDAALVNLLATVNDQLGAGGERLAERARVVPFPTADVATLIRELNATARSALELIPQLERQPGAIPLADRLSAFYDGIRTTATAGLQGSVTNAAAYRRTAAELAVTLEALPGLQADLQALLLLPLASVPPVASPSPSDSAGPSASDEPPATPTTDPTPPVGGPDLVTGGGFEGGVGSPWMLVLDPGVNAQLAADADRFASAPIAARISISTPTTSRGAIMLRQAGMPIDAGASYVMRVALAASEPREVVLRVASTDGVTYGARIVVATAAWTIYELQFSAPIGDPSAVLEIELGRSTATTWIDDVSLRLALQDVAP